MQAAFALKAPSAAPAADKTSGGNSQQQAKGQDGFSALIASVGGQDDGDQAAGQVTQQAALAKQALKEAEQAGQQKAFALVPTAQTLIPDLPVATEDAVPVAAKTDGQNIKLSATTPIIDNPTFTLIPDAPKVETAPQTAAPTEQKTNQANKAADAAQTFLQAVTQATTNTTADVTATPAVVEAPVVQAVAVEKAPVTQTQTKQEAQNTQNLVPIVADSTAAAPVETPVVAATDDAKQLDADAKKSDNAANAQLASQALQDQLSKQKSGQAVSTVVPTQTVQAPAPTPTHTTNTALPTVTDVLNNAQLQASADTGQNDAGSGATSGALLQTQPQQTTATQDTNNTSFHKFLAQANAQPVVDQVLVHIRNARSDGSSHIRIQLDPADLGKVEVRLEVNSEGKTGLHITADNRNTLEALQKDARSLERALTDIGLKPDSGSLSFNLRGEQQEQQRPKFHSYSNPEDEVDPLASLTSVISATSVISVSDGLDIRI